MARDGEGSKNPKEAPKRAPDNAGVLDRERREKEEKEGKERETDAKRLDVERQKILAKKQREEELAFLRSLVERGLIRPSTMEHFIRDERLDTSEVREIFETIDRIEEVKDIDSILPRNLRVMPEDYLSALEEEQKCAALIARIDEALNFLYTSSHPMSFSGIRLFTGFLFLLGQERKALVTVQEGMIDIKRSLQK